VGEEGGGEKYPDEGDTGASLTGGHPDVLVRL
jgi:hypothetical protein